MDRMPYTGYSRPVGRIAADHVPWHKCPDSVVETLPEPLKSQIMLKRKEANENVHDTTEIETPARNAERQPSQTEDSGDIASPPTGQEVAPDESSLSDDWPPEETEEEDPFAMTVEEKWIVQDEENPFAEDALAFYNPDDNAPYRRES